MTRLLIALCFLAFPTLVAAQADPLRIATVTRPPFSMVMDGRDTGFSVELWNNVATDLGRKTEFVRVDRFGDMFEHIMNGEVDGAIANISITAEREAKMDFSQPIFDSGLQIMLPAKQGGGSILPAILTRDIGIAVLIALGVLFGAGMLMWVFERKRQPYFDRPAKDAIFPSFWWALNVVVNGGFEERMPQSRPGRIFAPMLVVASLFVVSIFVAKVTAAMTVAALQNNIDSLADLDGHIIGTIEGSTAAAFLERRDIGTLQYDNLDDMLRAFENSRLEAVFFDAPILSYYAVTDGLGKTRMVERVFKPESYGMALPTNSPLREQINQSLLRMREDGTYDDLRRKWFGR